MSHDKLGPDARRILEQHPDPESALADARGVARWYRAGGHVPPPPQLCLDPGIRCRRLSETLRAARDGQRIQSHPDARVPSEGSEGES